MSVPPSQDDRASRRSLSLPMQLRQLLEQRRLLRPVNGSACELPARQDQLPRAQACIKQQRHARNQ